MKEMFIKKKGILIPFLRSQKLKTFKEISNEDINTTQSIINDTTKQNKLSSRRKLMQNWTDYLYKSNDPASNFLAAQINLVLSSPELVRNELMDKSGNVLLKIKNNENESLEKLQKYYITNDLPAIFSINANLYYYYLCQLEGGIENYINREDFIDTIENSGKMLMDNSSLLQTFNLFEKYCNRPLAGLPVETFLINYIYQLFYEFAYEQRASLTNPEFKKFCNELGKKLIFSSIALKARDYNKTYNVLFDITESINNNILLGN